MNWFRLVLGLLVLLIMFVSVVFLVSADSEVNRSIIINESGLPFNGSQSFSFGLLPYESFNVTLLDSNANVDFFFDDYIAMGNYSVTNWSFNYSVNNFSLSHNFSEVFVFELLNSINNDSLFINFNLSIINDLFVVENVSESWSVSVVNGSRIVNITRDILPFGNNLSYVIGGVEGESLSIEYGRFLEGPSIGVFDGDGLFRFESHFFLPINLSVGVYESNIVFGFSFNGSNHSLSYPVTFIVRVVEYEFLGELELNSECYGPNGFIDPACMDDVYEFLNDGFERYMSVCDDKRVDAYEDGWSDCEDEVEPELVVTGSLDSAVFDSWEVCKVERDDYIDKLSDCSEDLSGWRKKFFVINETLLSEKQGFVTKLSNVQGVAVEGYANCTQKFNALEKKTIRERWFIGVVPFVILVLGFGVFKYVVWKKKNRSYVNSY